jgi:hypothetical protein
MIIVEVHAPLEHLKSLKDLHHPFVDEPALDDRVDLDCPGRAVGSESGRIADPVEPANPLLDFLWSPRNAVQD